MLAPGSAWQDGDWVFPSSIGTPLEPRNLTRSFDLARQAADMTWLHLHDLRHRAGRRPDYPAQSPPGALSARLLQTPTVR